MVTERKVYVAEWAMDLKLLSVSVNSQTKRLMAIIKTRVKMEIYQIPTAKGSESPYFSLFVRNNG